MQTSYGSFPYELYTVAAKKNIEICHTNQCTVRASQLCLQLQVNSIETDTKAENLYSIHVIYMSSICFIKQFPFIIIHSYLHASLFVELSKQRNTNTGLKIQFSRGAIRPGPIGPISERSARADRAEWPGPMGPFQPYSQDAPCGHYHRVNIKIEYRLLYAVMLNSS